MPFPEAPRVIYAHNPLVEVLCQFRFPSNLSIETDLPSEFQKSIRDQYPLYTEKLELQLKVPDGLNAGPVVTIPTSAIQSIQRKNHEFFSADGQWKINLTRDFIAFSTLTYTRWEDFKSHFVGAYELFTSLYNPPFLTRIGLRYRDIIVRSKLGLENTAWTELLNPHILGIMSSSDVQENVLDINHVTEIQLKDGSSKVRIIDGLVKDVDTNEQCYSIDCDFHIVKNVEVKELLGKIRLLQSARKQAYTVVYHGKAAQCYGANVKYEKLSSIARHFK